MNKTLCSGMKNKISSSKSGVSLFKDIRDLIVSSRQRMASGINAELSLLYWNIGKRINSEVLGNERAEYGRQIVCELCERLTLEYGRGWGEKHVRRMMQFAVSFPEQEIVVSLIRQLSWTHLLAIIPIAETLKRDFYIEMCKTERWTVRTLRERITELYLNWLQKNEHVEGENDPVGLILCADKNDEHIELLRLERSNIRVAQYLTVLPPKKLLQIKFRQAVELAKERFARKKGT